MLWLVLQHREMLSKPVIISSVSMGLGVLLIITMNRAHVSDRLRNLAVEVPRKLVAEDLFKTPDTEAAEPTEFAENRSQPIDVRVHIYQDTLKVIADRPLSGWGLGTFRYVMPFYRDASLVNRTVLHPESSWLMLASEMGWVAVAIVLGLLAALYTRVPRLRSREGWTGRSAAVAALTVGLLHGIIDVPLHRPASGWIYLMIMGLAFYPPLKDARGERLRWPVGWRWALLGVGGVTLIISGIWVVARSAGNNLPLGPEELEARENQITRLYRDGERNAAAEYAWESIQRFPMHDGYYYQLGTILAQAEDRENDVANLFDIHKSLQPYWSAAPFYQGTVWLSADKLQAFIAWGEALERQTRVDQKFGGRNGTQNLFYTMLRRARDDQSLYDALFQYARHDKYMLIRWFQNRKAPPLPHHFQAAELLFSDPAFYDFWFSRGDREDLQAFLQKNPQYQKPAWKAYSRLLQQQGNLKEAVRVMLENRPEILQKLESGEIESDTLNRVRELMEAGNTIAAERIRKEALRLNEDQNYLLHQTKSALKERNWEDAWQYLNRLN
jgi:hypothetical protein